MTAINAVRRNKIIPAQKQTARLCAWLMAREIESQSFIIHTFKSTGKLRSLESCHPAVNRQNTHNRAANDLAKTHVLSLSPGSVALIIAA